MASHAVVKPFKVCFFFIMPQRKINYKIFLQSDKTKLDQMTEKKNIQTQIWPLDLEGDYLVESDSFCILHIYVHHKTLNAAGQYNRIKICVNMFMTNENLVVMKRESLMQV